MAHTAGPDPGVAEVVVDLWNWVRGRAEAANAGIDRPFDQVSPSLRRFVTANTDGMTDTVDAQIAWRLPAGFDAEAFAQAMLGWTATHIGHTGAAHAAPLAVGEGGQDTVSLLGPRTRIDFTVRGWERPWRGDRNNALVRSFLAAVAPLCWPPYPSWPRSRV
jgi:hypothetical protein